LGERGLRGVAEVELDGEGEVGFEAAEDVFDAFDSG
jgi:hypothetical protein